MDDTVRTILALIVGGFLGWGLPYAIDAYIAWTSPRPLKPSERFAQQEPLPRNWENSVPPPVQRFLSAEDRASHHVIPLRGEPYELTPRQAADMSAEELQASEARPGGAIIIHEIRGDLPESTPDRVITGPTPLGRRSTERMDA